MVSVGDTVKKGDLLVKGELEILDDSGKYPVISTVLRMQIFFLKLLMNIGKRYD